VQKRSKRRQRSDRSCWSERALVALASSGSSRAVGDSTLVILQPAMIYEWMRERRSLPTCISETGQAMAKWHWGEASCAGPGHEDTRAAPLALTPAAFSQACPTPRALSNAGLFRCS